VYYPSATWRPFADTAIGSGEFNLVFGHQSYLSSANNAIQAERFGLVTLPSDWASDNFSYSILAYTHTLTVPLNWLSITGGQYNLFSFDPSEFAGNAQTTFISYSFAQDATQTFPNAGLGAYLQAKAPNGQFRAAGGFQGATNLDGGTITASGIAHGNVLGWGNLQWTPTFDGLGDGIYSLLFYEQPFIAGVSTVRYYKYTLVKATNLTPDVQVFWNPAQKPSAGVGAVFTLRTTLSF
jgi:hypothetical protein